MKTIVLGMLAYLILTGCGLLMGRLVKLRLAEGMALAVALVDLVLFLCGLGGHFSAGIMILGVLGAAGFVLALMMDLKKKRKFEVASVYYVMLTLLFLGSLVICYGDFIWHIDEFHLYAASPKYMLETGRLPFSAGYIEGARGVLPVSLFLLYFQKFTGYNEGMMYTASALLTWIGLYLPFAGASERHGRSGERRGKSGGRDTEGEKAREHAWLTILLYTSILYIGIYSLYVYGTKNLYVDLPTIAWAGGLAAWRLGAGRMPMGKRAAVAVPVLVMVCLFKPHIGLLLAALAVLFMITEEARSRQIFSRREGRGSSGKRYLRVLPLAAAAFIILAFAACLVFAYNASGSLGGMRLFLGNAASVFKGRAKPVTIAYITALVGNSLSNRSELKLTLPVMSLIILAVFLVGAEFRGEKKRGRVYLVYGAAAAVIYLAALYGAFLFIFSYEESVKVVGISRYLTCLILFLLVIALVWFLGEGKGSPAGLRAETAFRIRLYGALALLIFLSTGLDRDYIPNMTALNKAKAAGYEDIKRTREQAKEIKKVLKNDGRVYILNQSGDNEFPTNTALYYLGGAVNNYIHEPWRFTEDGASIRVREDETVSVADFPQMLRDGHYGYVWIYTADKYLKKALPEVMAVDAEIGDGCLYEVAYDEGGEAAGLAKVMDLPDEFAEDPA